MSRASLMMISISVAYC